MNDVFTDASDRTRERARSSITELVSATAGPEAIREVPIFPGARTTERRPEPLHGLTAALQLRNQVTEHARRFVEELRGDGANWQAIAAAVRGDDDVDSETEQAVFEEFAVRGLHTFDTAWLSWRCSSCASRVIDYGPANPHPDDVEQGHTEDCARHDAEIRAYERDND